jgi:hypothetical protein
MSNTIGAFGAAGQTSRPSTSKNQTAQNAAQVCDICFKKHVDPSPRSKSTGTNKKSSSYATHVKKNHGFTPSENGNLTWEQHPWFIKVGCFAVHHLIEGQALEDRKWEDLCKRLGYNVNTLNNLVCLPQVAELACVLAVPLHQGNHNTAPTDEPADLNSRPTTETTYLCYSDAVAKKTEAVMRDIIRNCTTPARFVRDMDHISSGIFTKVTTFRWHLREDGAKYAPGANGCGINTQKAHKPCVSITSAGLPTTRIHEDIRSDLQGRPRFALAIGK